MSCGSPEKRKTMWWGNSASEEAHTAGNLGLLVSLGAHPAVPIKLSAVCSSGWQLFCNIMKGSQPEPPSEFTLKFLTYRNWEIINVSHLSRGCSQFSNSNNAESMAMNFIKQCKEPTVRVVGVHPIFSAHARWKWNRIWGNVILSQLS